MQTLENAKFNVYTTIAKKIKNNEILEFKYIGNDIINSNNDCFYSIYFHDRSCKIHMYECDTDVELAHIKDSEICYYYKNTLFTSYDDLYDYIFSKCEIDWNEYYNRKTHTTIDINGISIDASNGATSKNDILEKLKKSLMEIGNLLIDVVTHMVINLISVVFQRILVKYA